MQNKFPVIRNYFMQLFCTFTVLRDISEISVTTNMCKKIKIIFFSFFILLHLFARYVVTKDLIYTYY